MRFRPGEIVRLAHAPAASPLAGAEGVVEELAGPDEEGRGWNLTLRVAEVGGHERLVSVPEAQLEPTGLVLDERGRRVPLRAGAPVGEPRDRIELRLFTEITDGIAAARAAEEVERELLGVLAGASVTIVAERHWAEPFNYEFAVSVEPHDDPVEAVGWFALVGDGGWIASRDDGWRFELWWCTTAERDSSFLVPEVHSAQLAFLPWRSPRRRPESERPLMAVLIQAGLAEPAEPDVDRLDPEPGNEEP